MIAVEQHLVDRIADFALRGLHQTHAQIFRRIIHAVEISRDAPLRRQHHDGRGVRILLDLGIVLILKADSFRERIDRLRGSGQEMPAGSRAGASIALEIILLLRGGNVWSLLRIETHRDHVEFIAHIKLHHLHGAREPSQGFATEHGAVVVDQVQDQGLLAEVSAQSDRLACVVDKREIGRHLPVEMLLNANVLQIRRTDVGGR